MRNASKSTGEQRVSPPDNARRLMRLHLQDHYSASAGGVRLVEICRRSNPGTAFEARAARLDEGIRHDRVSHSPLSRVLELEALTAAVSDLLAEMHRDASRMLFLDTPLEE